MTEVKFIKNKIKFIVSTITDVASREAKSKL